MEKKIKNFKIENINLLLDLKYINAIYRKLRIYLITSKH